MEQYALSYQELSTEPPKFLLYPHKKKGGKDRASVGDQGHADAEVVFRTGGACVCSMSDPADDPQHYVHT